MELMVVVVVIGIMAGLALFKMGSYGDQTKLRQSAESLHQVLGWAKLQAEKTGDTVLVKISLPEVTVYRDLNGSGKWEATDSLLLRDSLCSTLKLVKPIAVPAAASGAAAASGLGDGTGVCGAGVCCTNGSLANPAWTDETISFCARTSPQLAPLLEDGAIYLASTNSRVAERWALVVNRANGVEPSLWTSEKVPAASSDWRKVR